MCACVCVFHSRHVEHFVCAQCEKPFLGQKHYERGGLAYCETHFNQLFGDVCYHCNEVIDGDGECFCCVCVMNEGSLLDCKLFFCGRKF